MRRLACRIPVRILSALILSALILSALISIGPASALSAQTPNLSPPEVGAPSAIVFEAESGKVLWSKNDSVSRAPASLTKILTALVVLEHLNLSDTATISDDARSALGGRMYAEAGWTFTVEDLLYGLLLQSGNDAAIALSEKVSQSVPSFVAEMNATARRAGATHTTFRNPHGLDEEGHTTTARDLALITRAAMNNPTFAQIVASKTHLIPWGDGMPKALINHNRLLWRYDSAIGIKTGFTDNAGRCLASAARKGDSTLITILLGSERIYDESIAIYDWAFANLEALRNGSSSTLVRSPVADGRVESVEQQSLDANRVPQRPRQTLPQPASSPGSGMPLLSVLATIVAAAIYSVRRRAGSVDGRHLGHLETLSLLAPRHDEGPATSTKS